MNLASEDRVSKAADFRDAVSAAFSAQSPADFNAALTALDSCAGDLFTFSKGWLGLLPSDSHNYRTWQPVTFVTGRQISKSIDPTFDPAAPHLPAIVRIPKPLFALSPDKPFLWMTNKANVIGKSPTDLALALGLPHFAPGDSVYRIQFPNWPAKAYIPTSLDAGLYWAWRIPPRSHTQPWGLTRHLITGDLIHPEVLVRLDEVRNQTVIAELVSARGENRVQTYMPNFLRKRTKRGIPR